MGGDCKSFEHSGSGAGPMEILKSAQLMFSTFARKKPTGFTYQTQKSQLV
jgi:hypothetical protein